MYKIKTYKEHFKEITLLSLPIIGGQVGHIIASISDNVMIGHVGSTELAAVSFANNIFFTFFLIGIGLSIGLTPLVAKENVNNNKLNCRKYLKNGIITNTLFGLVLTLILFILTFLMPYMGQPEKVTELAIPYFRLLTYSVIPYMIFLAFKQFLEGMSKPVPANMIILIANILNIILNYILIFGHLGFDALGIVGAGIATLISRILMLVFVILIMLKANEFKEFIVKLDLKKYSLIKMIKITKLGIPIGLQYFFEVGAFSAGGIIMGWVGKDQLAAHQIALNIAAIPFLIFTGVGSAVTITMSNYKNQNRIENLKRSGHTAMIATIIFSAITATIFMVFNQFLPSLYNNEEKVIQFASTFMILAAVFQFSDGLQAVILGILRGMEDVKLPAIVTTISYWFIAIPLCYLLTFTLNMGGVGVWYGYLIGLTFTAGTLFYRFEYLRKKLLIL